MKSTSRPARSRGLLLMAMAGAILSAPAQAEATPAIQEFRLEAGMVKFLSIPEKHLTLSESCRKKDGSMDCDAYRILKTVRMDLLKKPPVGGQEPGSLLCAAAGGEVIFGIDARKNENSFCRFKDGSIVSNGTIFYHANFVNRK